MTEYMLTRGHDVTGNLTAAGKLLFTPIKRLTDVAVDEGFKRAIWVSR